MARGTETLFDIQRRHGAACSLQTGGGGGHPGNLNEGITSELGGGYQELLAIRSPQYHYWKISIICYLVFTLTNKTFEYILGNKRYKLNDKSVLVYCNITEISSQSINLTSR